MALPTSNDDFEVWLESHISSRTSPQSPTTNSTKSFNGDDHMPNIEVFNHKQFMRKKVGDSVILYMTDHENLDRVASSIDIIGENKTVRFWYSKSSVYKTTVYNGKIDRVLMFLPHEQLIPKVSVLIMSGAPPANFNEVIGSP